MAEEQSHETMVRDLEKGRDGGAFSHTVTISAELYEKVHRLTSAEISDVVALSQSQNHSRGRLPSTFRKSYSLGPLRVTTTNTIES